MTGEDRTLESPNLAGGGHVRGGSEVLLALDLLVVLVRVVVVILGLVIQRGIPLQADGRPVLLNDEEVLGGGVHHGVNHVGQALLAFLGRHLGTGFHVIDDSVGVQAAGLVHKARNGVVESQVLDLGKAGIGNGGHHVIILLFLRGFPRVPEFQAGIHHMHRAERTVDIGIFILACAVASIRLFPIEGLQLAYFNGRARGTAGEGAAGNGVIVDAVLLEGDRLGPCGKIAMAVLPAVQGLVVFDGFYIVRVEVLQGHAHTPGVLATQGAEVQDHLHLFPPALIGQTGIVHSHGFNIVVHHHVVEIEVIVAGAAQGSGQVGPAVVEHHHTAGVIHGIILVGGHIRSGFL